MDCVRLLVDAGADMNCKSKYGRYAADIAIDRDYKKIANFLSWKGSQMSKPPPHWKKRPILLALVDGPLPVDLIRHLSLFIGSPKQRVRSVAGW